MLLTEEAARQQGRRDLPRQARSATIRAEPATDTDPVYVSIDGQPGYKRGPCYGWQPRYTVVPAAGDDPLEVTPVFPQDGDPCVVVETDQRQLVILTWWRDA